MSMIKKLGVAACASLLLVSCAGKPAAESTEGCGGCCSPETKQAFIAENFKFAADQTNKMMEMTGGELLYPRTTENDGSIKYAHKTDWTKGFFPGTLWYIYEETQDPAFKAAAERWTAGLEELQYMTSNHDIGFVMYCSYGNEYRLSKDEAKKKEIEKILVQSAESLCTRYNPTVRSIESWNRRKSWDGKTWWEFPVIIDNMMNLELLYFASQVTGDSKYADIATAHATTTMENHFREDYSSYHVVDYDTTTGKAIHHQTCQGYSDNSTWARGQAWAIYGYTMVYRFTKDAKFLALAENLANLYLDYETMPEDLVPLWDFNVNQEGFDPDWDWKPELYKESMPRDASAAAVTTSALFELCKYSTTYGDKFKHAAVKGLKSLASDAYRAPLYENNNFILMHSTGSLPHGGEIDKPLSYADYYFLEAMLRFKAMSCEEK